MAVTTGSQAAELRYKAYGVTRYTWGTTPTTYRYTGQRQESTIGLYYYNARWYDPALGRFVQPDTIVPSPGNPQSLNRYSYGLNNPVKYVDPTGHDPLDEKWVAAFRSQHNQNEPNWRDRLIRLFSIAFPDEWDPVAFYDSKGQYIEGSIEKVLRDDRPAGRTWAGVPNALENLAGWYSSQERDLFIRDIGTLFGGLADRVDEPGAWQTVRNHNNPVHVWAYIGAEGLPQSMTGTSDADANIHHWAWALTMGGSYGPVGSAINAGREVTQFRGDFVNTWSDILIGTSGAAMGLSLRVFGPSDARQSWNFHMLQWLY